MHNKEFWLFDISSWPTVYHAVKAIEKVPLNLESDLYLFKTKAKICLTGDTIRQIDIVSRYFENKYNNYCETKLFKNAICLLLLQIHF